ncbi:MAG: nickel-responsive transcriptional regulator NikR, partial [Candidatus Methanofastidiosa archaeon]|nr:nickel-responsive transcriptional regulator NikR [Candidatus Methanofastidiosa archaeon]
GVMEDLTDIQHDFREYISAVMHIHMTEKYCLEVITLKGNIKYIRDLTEKIMRLKGVEHVKLTSTGIKE